MFIDEEAMSVYYPASGTGAQVLAMNGTPTIEVLLNKIYWHSII